AIVPTLGNETIAMVKGTSLASIIAVNELTFRSQQIVAQNFAFFEVFTAAGIIYLAITTLLTGIQSLLERRFNLEREPGSGFGSELQRMFGFNLFRPRGALVPTRRTPPAARMPAAAASTDHPALDFRIEALIESAGQPVLGSGEAFVACR